MRNGQREKKKKEKKNLKLVSKRIIEESVKTTKKNALKIVYQAQISIPPRNNKSRRKAITPEIRKKREIASKNSAV